MISEAKLYAAIKTRCSSRSFAAPPSEKELSLLREVAAELSRDGFRIHIGCDVAVFGKGIGAVKGASVYAAFISKGASPFTVGYLGERFILSCEALELGSCWLGGTYDARYARTVCGLEDGEKLMYITPIGKAATVGHSTKRKSIDTLCGLLPERFERLPLWQRSAVECARLAPSAVNLQPWRFIVDTYSITVKSVFGLVGGGLVDCGIAMLHIELGATQCGTSGIWEYGAGQARFVMKIDGK